MCRISGEVWAASFGYFDDLIQNDFADPAPILHADVPVVEGEQNLQPDGAEVARFVHREIGFRAHCLTVQAEQTCGEKALNGIDVASYFEQRVLAQCDCACSIDITAYRKISERFDCGQR